MGRSVKRSLMRLGAVLLTGTSLAPNRLLPQSTHACGLPATGSAGITADAVAGLPFDVAIDSLRRLCPVARDTVVTMDQSGRTHAGLTFPLSFSVLAMQNAPPRGHVAGDQPPDGWLIQGLATLPGGVNLGSTWGELALALGSYQTSAGGVAVVVRFCRLPRFLFSLDIAPGVLRTLPNGAIDDRSIPAGTRVHHLTVLSGPLANALTPCR